MKKIICVIYVTIFALSINIVNAQNSGTADNLSWNISNDTLYVNGNGAIPDWFYYYVVDSFFSSAVIGEGITTVSNYAFFGCSSLISITISNSVVSMGNSVFNYCNSLTNIDVDIDNPNYYSDNGVLFDKQENTLIFCPIGKTGHYTIPNTTTTIRDYAFIKSKLDTLVIPNSVITIGEEDFNNATDIFFEANTPPTITANTFKYNYIYIPCGSLETYKNAQYWDNLILKYEILPTADGNVFDIKTLTDSTCSVLQNSNYHYTGDIVIPSVISNVCGDSYEVTELGFRAFFICDYITSVTIPNTVKKIGNSAFFYCEYLDSINIPEGITQIGYGTFEMCSSLTSITLPNSIKTIGDYAFANMFMSMLPDNIARGLTSIVIPDSVTSIGQYVFADTGLTSAIIPASLTNIGDFAFSHTELTEIYNRSNTPQNIDSNVFDGVDKQNCILYVPVGSLQAYQDAPVWQDFIIMEEITLTTSATEKLQKNNISIFPNPVCDYLSITGAAGKSVTVYDNLGRKILEQKISNDNEQISANNWAKGLYFVKILDNGNYLETAKLIKK